MSLKTLRSSIEAGNTNSSAETTLKNSRGLKGFTFAKGETFFKN
jgi:hypothetical protein